MRGPVLFFIFIVLSILSLFIGVSQLGLSDIFHLSAEQRNILFSSRIPRTVSIIISGSSLALAGLIMQQMMQNKFVSPTTAGTMEWAKLGILIALVFFPHAHILIKLLFAMLLSIAGTFFFMEVDSNYPLQRRHLRPASRYHDWRHYLESHNFYRFTHQCCPKHRELVER